MCNPPKVRAGAMPVKQPASVSTYFYHCLFHCHKASGSRSVLLSVLFLLVILLPVTNSYAKTNGIKVTLRAKDAPLSKVISQIKSQTTLKFLFETDIMKQAKPVTIDVTDTPVENALEICFRNQPLEFRFFAETVVIRLKNKGAALQTGGDSAGVEEGETRLFEISGQVLNEENEPLMSATVYINRTGRGTQTGVDGGFKIKEVGPDDLITVSYTGYKQNTVKVGNRTVINLVMQIAENELDRAVVQAYGKTTKRLGTGNIAKITASEIEKQPVMNPLLALQGRIPGLVITQTSGYVSGPVTISLRGKSVMDLPSQRVSTAPLYIIDGVPLTISNDGAPNGESFIATGFVGPAGGQNPLFSIDPATIESIEVLKDADATAIYGSRAANGVIMITTKKGKVGKTQLSASLKQGISKIPNKRWDLLNTSQYLKIRREAFDNDVATYGSGFEPTEFTAPDLLLWDSTRYTDWQGLLYNDRTGYASDAQLNVSGGDVKTKVYIGTGYMRSTDILTIKGSNERAYVLFNVRQQLAKNLDLNFSANYSYAKVDIIDAVGSATLSPNAPSPFDSLGRPDWNAWEPVVDILSSFGKIFQPYTAKTINLISNANIDYRIVKNLSFRLNLGYTDTKVDQLQQLPDYSISPTSNNINSSRFGNNTNKNWIIEPQATYSTLLGKSRITVMVGASLQQNKTRGSWIIGSGYSNYALMQSMDGAADINIVSDNFAQYKYAAVFGRINYQLNDKYILNINARRDGSSRFGLNNLFGNFASIAGAWIFSEEQLIKKNLRFLSFGKLRGSYGSTGSDGVGNYAYLSQWGGVNAYNGTSALYPVNLLNPDYHWQVNKKLEASVDLGFWRDRILISATWYMNRCDNQLLTTPVPYITGFSGVVNNLPALVENSGWESTVQIQLIKRQNVNWSIQFVTSRNQNKLLKFPGFEQSPYVDQYVIGKSLNIVRLLKYTGVDPQTGLYTFEDRNKDGIIETLGALDDRYVYAYDPKFTGGLSTNFNYKGLSIYAFFNIVKQNAFNALTATNATTINLPTSLIGNYWQKPGDNSLYAKLTAAPFMESSYYRFFDSDGIFTDASFVRLQNLAFSYNLPQRTINKIKLKACAINLQAQNLFVFSKYKGVDPETQNFGGMPPLRTIVCGINLTF